MKKLTIDELNKLRQYYAPTNLIPFEEAKLTRTSKKEWVWTDGEHVWTTSAYNILRAAQPCPYCGGRKAIQGFNDLATTRPEIAAQWDYQANGNLTPKDVTYGSDLNVT